MSDKTQMLIEAPIGGAQERCPHGDEFPVDDPFQWFEWQSVKRYEWPALRSLRNGDVHSPRVFVELSAAAAIDRAGMELLSHLEDREDRDDRDLMRFPRRPDQHRYRRPPITPKRIGATP